MFEFIVSIQFAAGLTLGAVLGAFVGVGLARQSNTANEFYDRTRAKWDLERAELEEKIAALKKKVREQ